tara:strand:- start:1873 stop:2433 length:561 start_codon:yes stop_codon:yes gene_type:complete
MADPTAAYPTSDPEGTASQQEAYPTSQQELTEDQKLAELRRRAIEEMRNNPTAVAERLRARGANEDQIAGLFSNVGVTYPRVDIGQIEYGQQPAGERTVLPTVNISPAYAQYGPGVTTLPSGQVAFPTTQIQPASVVAGPGAQTRSSGQIAMPTVPIQAGAPMTDEDILKGGMYVQPQQGVVAGNQ